ncbi:cysteine--tRNA ligase, chloroplastic/mitochondrial [Selaginella moellendorffii]|uniref:cysteine--tRNA ligase, chloroplastic/mitochondrial n=1 Tax=Selaginella moellendorffii TaxID=88036 RepID=UPI000D1CBE99|nr:cysteine--tRNA ligase, chloroplastic/mitochondrial [Selaginella moellendorffii]|eukprot:XP_024520074.1 cysteine--tRNA ligase, chloroplastic/mitochondrial [Selaginella moellendorffii]
MGSAILAGAPNHSISLVKVGARPSRSNQRFREAGGGDFSSSHRHACARPRSSSFTPSLVYQAPNARVNKEESVEILLFNTMSREKEVFRPRIHGKLSMYVCGVTAYDYSHIGHARVYVFFDVLYRYFTFMGYEVTYVRNFTDIDDKIIKRANDLGDDPIELSNRFCDEFRRDMASLRCLAPSLEPRVSRNIDQIIKMISQILENGYGYVLDNGDVYFSLDKFVPAFPDCYGRLSGRKLDDNRAGERVAVDDRKLNPGDFVLWKSSKDGEPSWESPWGAGRPGWHIECSAMSGATLGSSFDIHGGGMDLIFPHHENEIVQSRAACHESNITYWMHNGFVTVDSEKMSKSLGNFFTIREVFELYHPLALRWFLLCTHYRSPINYSESQLQNASQRLFYLYQTLFDAKRCVEGSQKEEKSYVVSQKAAENAKALRLSLRSSLADDLNTPVTIGALSEPLKLMNELLHSKRGRKDKSRYSSLDLLRLEVEQALEVLGFSVADYSQVLQELRSKALKRAGLTEDELLLQIHERAAARASKDFGKSDEIRDKLSSLGISLMDGGGDETLWRPSVTSEECF